ncbi:MAG TPA: GNAT family N-acetyltransferase [Gemmatimonadales bacterium]|jgi:ribosomal protein S18 acetylase RimI-like enzyme
MTNPTVHVRPGAPADASALAHLAVLTFRTTYEPFNTAANIDQYVGAAFAVDQVRSDLNADNLITLLASVDDELVGYGQLRLHVVTPLWVPGRHPVELHRFYVDAAWHGRHVAAHLLEHCVSAAAATGSTSLWLGVWQQNARAIRFYRKHGFHAVGRQEFMLGDDRQDDWLMAKPLAGE